MQFVSRTHLYIAFLALLALSACGGGRPIGPLQTASGPSSNITVETGDLPHPRAGDFTSQYSDYIIGPFDVLEIGVFGVEGLEPRNYRTDASGQFSFPLLGTVDAGGITPAELRRQITMGLRANFIRDPQVTVNLKETTSRVVTVAGQVARPGPYPVLGKMTLIRAVATAGGMSEFAKQDEVIILRDVNGQRYAGVYNLDAIQRGNYGDPEVFANDVVIVGDSPQRRLVRDLVGGAPAIVAPLLVALTQGN